MSVIASIGKAIRSELSTRQFESRRRRTAEVAQSTLWHTLKSLGGWIAHRQCSIFRDWSSKNRSEFELGQRGWVDVAILEDSHWLMEGRQRQ